MDELALGTVVLATNGHGEFAQETADPFLGLDSVLAAAFANLIDTRMGVIGRVVGSEKEPAGGHTFCIWADANALTLDVGHIVVAFSEEAAVVGVVDEPRRYSDVQSFLDDYFDRLVEGEIAELQATKRPEFWSSLSRPWRPVTSARMSRAGGRRSPARSGSPPKRPSGSPWIPRVHGVRAAGPAPHQRQLRP
jgi:hypothetical protein